MPNLVRNVAHNLRHGRSTGAFFEIAPVFAKRESPDLRGENRPFTETTHLGIVQWGEEAAHWLKPAAIPLFFKAKGALEAVLRDWQYKTVKWEPLKVVPPFLHPGQSARIIIEGKPVGFLGRIHPGLAYQLEIDTPLVIGEFNLKTLFLGQPRLSRAKPLPKFPTVERDVALLAPEELPAGDIKSELMKAAGPLLAGCYAFDLYSGEKLPPGKKSLAFRLTYQDPQKTLSDEEVNAMHQKAVTAVCQKLPLSVR